MTPTEYLPAAQAAQRTHIPVAALIAMAQEGRIAAVETDRGWYFHRADLANVDPPPRRTQSPMHDGPLATGEVARLFRVAPKTVTKWADSGKIFSFRTIGGHRRFPRAAVDALLEEQKRADASARDRGGPSSTRSS